MAKQCVLMSSIEGDGTNFGSWFSMTSTSVFYGWGLIQLRISWGIWKTIFVAWLARKMDGVTCRRRPEFWMPNPMFFGSFSKQNHGAFVDRRRLVWMEQKAWLDSRQTIVTEDGGGRKKFERQWRHFWWLFIERTPRFWRSEPPKHFGTDIEAWINGKNGGAILETTVPWLWKPIGCDSFGV